MKPQRCLLLYPRAGEKTVPGSRGRTWGGGTAQVPGDTGWAGSLLRAAAPAGGPLPFPPHPPLECG